MAGRAGAVAAWRPIVGCMLIMMVVFGLTVSGIGVVAPDWIRSFSLSAGSVMLVITATTVLSGFGGIAVSLLARRYSPSTLLACGVLAATLALVVGSQSGSFAMLLAGVVPLAAIANALTGPVVGQGLAVRQFSRPGLAIAVVSMGMSLGTVFGPLIIAGLLRSMDWQQALLVSAGIVFVAGGLLLLATRGTGAAVAASPQDPSTASSSSVGPETAVPARSIVLSATFIGATLFQFPLMALMSGMFFHLVLIYTELGADSLAAAGVMSVTAAAGLAGTFAAGWLVDRVPHRLLQVVAIVLMGGAQLLLAYGTGARMLPLAAVLMSVGNSILFPLVPAILARRFGPEQFQRAIGLFQPVLFSAMLGAVVVGVVHDAVGSYPAAFRALLPVLLVVAAGVVLSALPGRNLSRA